MCKTYKPRQVCKIEKERRLQDKYRYWQSITPHKYNVLKYFYNIYLWCLNIIKQMYRLRQLKMQHKMQQELRERKLRELKIQKELKEKELREYKLKEQERKEQELKERKERNLREQELRERELREIREREWREMIEREQIERERKEQELLIQEKEYIFNIISEYVKEHYRDYRSDSINMIESDNQCAICWMYVEDSIDIPWCQMVSCRHKFHSICIDNWIEFQLKDDYINFGRNNKISCPMCRSSKY